MNIPLHPLPRKSERGDWGVSQTLLSNRGKEAFLAYQEHKENKEHVGDEINRPKDPVGIVNGIVVKVTKNDPKLREAGGKEEHKVTHRHICLPYFLKTVLRRTLNLPAAKRVQSRVQDPERGTISYSLPKSRTWMPEVYEHRQKTTAIPHNSHILP